MGAQFVKTLNRYIVPPLLPLLHFLLSPGTAVRQIDTSMRRSYSPFALKGGVAKWEGRGLQNRYERVRFSPPPLPFAIMAG
jgi:hypothetical protein